MTIKSMMCEIVFAAHARSSKDHADGALRLFELAASFLYRRALNHPLVHGNKRTALLTTYIFFGRQWSRTLFR